MKLGQQVRVKAWLLRVGRRWERSELDPPTRGILIGVRTRSDGYMDCEFGEYGEKLGGSYYVADRYFKTYLIAPDLRGLIVALTDDVEVVS